MHKEDTPLPVSSSYPPEFSQEALTCYQAAVKCLNLAGIPFVIAGAFAIHHHTGIWRTTKDLDLFLQAELIPEALQELNMYGFSTEIKDPVWLAKAYSGTYFVDLITATGNAALLVDRSWIARSEPFEFFGIPCRVLGAEEIIATKLFVSRRERFDLADVVHLIRAMSKPLDWKRIQFLMSGHEELLLWSLVFFAYVYPAHVGLIPREVWNTLLQKLRKQIDNPQANAPFRGALIDPNMFAIDIDEWGERDLYREYRNRHPYLLEIDPENESDTGSG
jgi:hypothetical protein